MLGILKYLLVFVEVITSLLLIGVILLQKTKSQGVGMAFGGAMGESLFGAQVGNVLTKTTVVLGIVFLVNTTLLAMLETGRGQDSVTDAITVTAAAAQPAPEQPPAAREAAPFPASGFDSTAPMAPGPAAAPAAVAPAPIEPVTVPAVPAATTAE